MNKIILTASLSLLLSACASSGGTATAASDATQAIAAAEAAKAKAAAVGYEWRDTGKMITAAKKANEAKEYDKAVALAGQAERQSNNAVEQHAQQNATLAIAAAEAAKAKAAAVGYEWRDTGKMITAAKKAKETKEYDKAVALAGQAERQSNNAVEQHAQQIAALSAN